MAPNQPAAPSRAATTFQEIELALQAAENWAPTLVNVIGEFNPEFAALARFMPLFRIALQGVHTVAQATGVEPMTAQKVVIQHLTPGQPNAPQLTGPPGRPDGSQIG